VFLRLVIPGDALMLRRCFCGGDQGVELQLAEMFRLGSVTCVPAFGERTMYMVYRLKMGRLSNVVLLSLLLILSGVPGATSLLCAQPMKAHAHACCKGHERVNAAHCGAASVRLGSPCCCKMAPVNSAPAQNLPASNGSNDGTVILGAISDIAGDIPASSLFSDRGSPQVAKLQHSPVHALLCTFLV
jgi:hypothetical protein